MPDQETPVATSTLSQEEYRSLRATVQQRGTIRIVVALVCWCVWAGLAVASWSLGAPPLAGLVSLVVLVGGFELVLSLHTGVERVGRYIQLMYEPGSPTPAWEHVAMGMGGRWLSPGGLDPLFGGVFLMAAVVNALPALVAGARTEMVGGAVVHLAFAVRIQLARQFASRQRAHDLEALRQVISSNSLVSKIQQQR